MKPQAAEVLTGISWYYHGVSALERLYKKPHSGFHSVLIQGTTVDLAKRVENLRFPGLDSVDACADLEDGLYYFRCEDDPLSHPVSCIEPLDFYFDHQVKRWIDPRNRYKAVRAKDWQPEINTHGIYKNSGTVEIVELAVFASRFLSSISSDHIPHYSTDEWNHLAAEEIRRILSLIVTGSFSWKGLEILHRSGFIARFLPELLPMDVTNHSKEGHPEGNVWEHSLETLKYRKAPDLVLGLSLLLHDSGKPHAIPTKQHLFAGHAEIGAQLAKTLLRKLGFSPIVVADVSWLVEYHMIPQALADLPLSRIEGLMGHNLFPLLLELYRCDLSSTWRGPDGYYEACKKFRSWLRTRTNPYTSLDRKSQIRKYVAN